MVIIMLTGNYNFFNFLFMGLCLSLADDSWLAPGRYKFLFVCRQVRFANNKDVWVSFGLDNRLTEVSLSKIN